jgi:hypothetical protein
MATNIDVTALAGFFKDRFGENGSMLPSSGYDELQKMIGFSELKLGEKITQPVRTAHSTGWTFAGGSTTGTMFALNDANSPTTVEASWTSVEFAIREKISWKALRAAQSNAQAFGNAFDEMIRDMKESAQFALDFNLLYGQSNLGVLADHSGSGAARDYTLTKASSCPGLWYKLHGAKFDAYSAYGGTLHNENATLVVTGVDLDSEGRVVVSVSGNATDLTAIDTDLDTAAVLIPRGANANMMVGIDAIASVPTSYAGITSATYPMFTSTSVSASSASLTYSKLMHALKRNTLKSGKGRRVCLCSESTLTDLGDNLTALQRLDKGGMKVELGQDAFTFVSPIGRLEFKGSAIVKEGEAFIVDPGEMERVGSVDFTFDPTGKGEYFEPVSGYAGHEVVGYWDQTLKVNRPQTITKIDGIVNTL